MFIRATLAMLVLVSTVHAQTAITGIELTAPPIDFGDVNRIWERLKKDVGAPMDFPPPPIVLDWEVPIIARMGFQYPSKDFPDSRLQISVAPRTLDMMEREIIVWALGHELAHYLFLLRENNYDLTKKVFTANRKHHCDPEYKKVTQGVADEMWNIYHSDVLRNKMYNEVMMACASHPEQ